MGKTTRKFLAICPGMALGMTLLAGCTQGPDMSGIAGESKRSVKRYDIVQSIATTKNVVVAGTQSGVALVSSDQGKTWVRNPLGQASLVDIAVCGDQGFVAIDHYHKVWNADAEGKNWQAHELKNPQTAIAVTCDPQGGWWVVGANATIAGSKDQGKSWQVTDLGADAQLTTINFIDEKRAVALGEFGMTVVTDDGGATWKNGSKIAGDFYPYAALFKRTGEGWASGIAGTMLATRDGGKTWTKQANNAAAAFYRLFMHDGAPFGVGAGGVIGRLDKDTWRPVQYSDAVPVFLAGGASLPGESAVVLGGPGGLLRIAATAAKK